MFIAHKSNVLQTYHQEEWRCRRTAKGFVSKSEYWTWLATITSQDSDGHDVVTYPSETFTIVECTDEDVQARLNQLGDYTKWADAGGALVYNISWSDSKVSAVTSQDESGEDITIQTHFSGDDTAKDARNLVWKWANVRSDRNSRLAETDHLALKDNTLSAAMKTHRQALRDVPEDNADVDNISWPKLAE